MLSAVMMALCAVGRTFFDCPAGRPRHIIVPGRMRPGLRDTTLRRPLCWETFRSLGVVFRF